MIKQLFPRQRKKRREGDKEQQAENFSNQGIPFLCYNGSRKKIFIGEVPLEVLRQLTATKRSSAKSTPGSMTSSVVCSQMDASYLRSAAVFLSSKPPKD
jgi:hypothetical protein